MKRYVLGLAENERQADRLVSNFQTEGFDLEKISVLFSDRRKTNAGFTKVQGTEYSTTDYSTETDTVVEKRTNGSFQKDVKKDVNKSKVGHEKNTKAPEGATAGALSGGVIGGSLGLLAGIGALAIPGLGPFIAAGPLMAALAGSAVGGSLGLVIGALVGLGVPEYEAKIYENGLKKGGILISVEAANSEQVNRAQEIFKKNGAKDISTTSQTTKSSW